MGRGSVFISHASEQAKAAASLCQKLRGRHFEVFLDQDSLPAGGSYDSRIRAAVEACDVFVFLITPQAMTAGKYSLTELGYAKRRWSNPDMYVLPVLLSDTPIDEIDPYLRQSVSFFRIKGNFETEVADAIEELRKRQRWAALKRALVAVGIITLSGSAAAWLTWPAIFGDGLGGGGAAGAGGSAGDLVSTGGGAGRAAGGGTGGGGGAGAGGGGGAGGSAGAGAGGAAGTGAGGTSVIVRRPACKPDHDPETRTLVCRCGDEVVGETRRDVVSLDVYLQGHQEWKCPPTPVSKQP
jgi:hypothetical protein